MAVLKDTVGTRVAEPVAQYDTATKRPAVRSRAVGAEARQMPAYLRKSRARITGRDAADERLLQVLDARKCQATTSWDTETSR
jgi:hypothetical protein